jgi:uncharacterized protein YbjT (DUF2867 family)
MTYLVTGATGKAGRQVVTALLDGGHRVRALTRDPVRATFPAGVEVVVGDLTKPSSVPFDGVVGVHLITVGGDDYATLDTGPELADLAKKAGVRRVAVLWNGEPGPVEAAIEKSGLDWTWLQANDFMGNAHHLAPAIRADGQVVEPFGDVPAAVVDEADVGAVSAAVLTQDGHSGKAYALTGPEALTPRQRLAIIGAAIGHELRFVELTEAQARERWRQQGVAEEMIDILASWQGHPPPHAYTVTAAVEEILGRPPRSFAQWAADHVSAFIDG